MNVTRILPFAALLLLASSALGYDPLIIDRAAPAGAPQDFTVKDAERDRETPIRVYLPSKREATHVVLFSHGLGGSRAGSKFLGDHWAARGYVAVFFTACG